MNSELEEMIETYKRLLPDVDTTPSERMFLAKKRRDLWWSIKQASNGFSEAMRKRIYRSAHPEKVFQQLIKQRDRDRKLKVEVLTYYGKDKCACVMCNESNLACLSIDHINGRGTRHRKGSLRTSHSFYLWLKKNDYPVGYQTLCMNCQFVKRFENNELGKYADEPIDWQTK